MLVLAYTISSMSIAARRIQRVRYPRSILWGAHIHGSTYGSGRVNAPWDTTTWNLFESHAGKPVSMLHFGLTPWWQDPFYGGTLDLAVARGAYPFIDMMIANDSGITLAAIASGTYDSSWRTWCQAAKTYGKPFLFRWCGEMNGDWRDYGKEEIARPGAFVAAWRHIKDIADEIGATNITWVWCPNVDYGGQITFAQVYPGHAYVDWISLDGYNWGTSGSATWVGQWTSWYNVFKPSYDALLALAPTKPMIIAETACNEGGGSKAAWITDALLTQLPHHFPRIRAFSWFNWPIPENGVTQQWPIESSPSAQAAFAAAIASPYFIPGSSTLPWLNSTSLQKVPAP